ncbi:MAG: chorismate mutase [Holophagaceae bacterium]|nr:chorismate mutase [Holophagaceae bacterium]
MNVEFAHIPEIERLRSEIDRIDDQLLELLNQRAKIVVEVGQQKVAEQPNSPKLYVSTREKSIMERLANNYDGIFPFESIELIYKEIFKTCLKLQK